MKKYILGALITGMSMLLLPATGIFGHSDSSWGRSLLIINIIAVVIFLIIKEFKMAIGALFGIIIFIFFIFYMV